MSELSHILHVFQQIEQVPSNLKMCHPRCVMSVTQSCSVYKSIYIHTVMNTTLLHVVAIYNVQLHVSALYVGHHQVVQRTY